jgi:cell division protein YceG involved in septum cleavage
VKLAFFAFLLVFLVLPLAYGSVGMGISDYDSKTAITGSTTIKVGKVTNTGNETLILSWVWKQTNATVNMTLPISSVFYNWEGQIRIGNYTLEPNESFEPAIQVGDYSESFVGNYTGIVQIKASYPVQGGGDQVVPGGMVHVTLIVNDSPGQQKQDALRLVILLVCVLSLVFALVLFYARQQLKKHHKVPAGPFRQFWRKL